MLPVSVCNISFLSKCPAICVLRDSFLVHFLKNTCIHYFVFVTINISTTKETTQQIRHWSYRSEWKFDAAVQASSSVSTRSGTRRHPGPFNVRSSCCSVLSVCAARHASIFDTTTNVGTPRARANPRCSLVVPTVIKQCRQLITRACFKLQALPPIHFFPRCC